MPRMITLARLSLAFLIRVISTTSSLATSGRPSRPAAISGWVSTMAACSRSTPLCISVSDERRITTALSNTPVSTSVCRSPSASMVMAANTNTTKAMPAAVSRVVVRRASRLRRL